MKLNEWEIVLTATVIVLIGLLAAAVWLRRKKCRNKVRKMSMWEKLEKINALAEPFGFFYVKDWDIFSTRRDAWQRKMGYEALFDAAAPAAHMVMDVWPVYFNYGGRTWLIEFWKGQYGINTGGEVGVYHADRIIPPGQYRFAHFDAASDDEMPLIRCKLTRGSETLYAYQMRHWWLTGFDMGRFSKPDSLVLNTEFIFDNPAMGDAFCEGLMRHPEGGTHEHCKNRVYVRMNCSPKVSVLSRLHRAWAQMWNRFWVWAFVSVTRPFASSLDRVLFLYEQLPGCLKKLLGFDRKHYRKKKKKERACHEL